MHTKLDLIVGRYDESFCIVTLALGLSGIHCLFLAYVQNFLKCVCAVS